MIKSKLTIIACCIALSGCAVTYKELKESQPLLTQRVNGSAKKISSCVYEYLKENTTPTNFMVDSEAHERFYDDSKNRWYITTDWVNWMNGRTGIYLSFIEFEQQANTVLINVRAVHQNRTKKPIQAINQCH